MYEGITPSVPERFRRDLKQLDSGLDCEFSREHGRFVITQTGKISGKVPVIVVLGDDGGGYRYPDQRDIRVLQEADLHRKGQEVRDRIQKGEDYMARTKEKQDKFNKDEIRTRTREDRIQLSNTYVKTFNLGKGSSQFRRIEHKPKGFVVRDKRLIKATDSQQGLTTE